MSAMRKKVQKQKETTRGATGYWHTVTIAPGGYSTKFIWIFMVGPSSYPYGGSFPFRILLIEKRCPFHIPMYTLQLLF